VHSKALACERWILEGLFSISWSFACCSAGKRYCGESTVSYFLQMLGLAVQDFLSAATGIAVAFALFRGFAAKSTGAIGIFWEDVTRIAV